MVRWVAGEEERKREPKKKWEKPALTFSVSVWNILEACVCLKSLSLGNNGPQPPCFFRSYLHTKDQLLSSCYAAKPPRGLAEASYQQVLRTHRDPINFSGILRPWPFKGQWGEIPVRSLPTVNATKCWVQIEK